MRAELKSIKLGSRVVYVVGGVEYSALALGTASEGWNSGIHLSSIFLSLIYLNELAVPVKVLSAPLLGAVADEEHLARVASQAAEKTFGYVHATADQRAELVAGHLEHIKANPRTNGWRPYVEGEEVATLRAQLAEASAVIDKLNSALNQPPTPQPDASAEPGDLPSGLPSAEDLDAAAADQTIPGYVVQDGDLFKPVDPTSYADVAAAAEAAANEAGSLADAQPASIENPEVPETAEQEADKDTLSQAVTSGK